MSGRVSRQGKESTMCGLMGGVGWMYLWVSSLGKKMTIFVKHESRTRLLVYETS